MPQLPQALAKPAGGSDGREVVEALQAVPARLGTLMHPGERVLQRRFVRVAMLGDQATQQGGAHARAACGDLAAGPQPAIVRQDLGDAFPVPPAACGRQPEVPVLEGLGEARVVPADIDPQRPAVERGHVEGVSGQQLGDGELTRAPDTVVTADETDPGVDHSELRVALEDGKGPLDVARVEVVVGVQRQDVAAARVLDGEVARGSGPAVLAAEQRYRRLVRRLLEDRERGWVGRPVVHEDDLHVRVGLGRRAAERRPQIPTRVEHGYHDGDERAGTVRRDHVLSSERCLGAQDDGGTRHPSSWRTISGALPRRKLRASSYARMTDGPTCAHVCSRAMRPRPRATSSRPVSGAASSASMRAARSWGSPGRNVHPASPMASRTAGMSAPSTGTPAAHASRAARTVSRGMLGGAATGASTAVDATTMRAAATPRSCSVVASAAVSTMTAS